MVKKSFAFFSVLVCFASISKAFGNCQDIFPEDPHYKDPFRIAREECQLTLLAESGKCEKSNTECIFLREVLQRAQKSDCAPGDSADHFASTLCRVADYAIQGKSCSSLTPKQIDLAKNRNLGEDPSIQFHKESAIAGVCRALEKQSHPTAKAERREKLKNSLRSKMPPSIDFLFRNKAPEGGLPYFETSIIGLSFPLVQSSNVGKDADEGLTEGIKDFVLQYLPDLKRDDLGLVPAPHSGSSDTRASFLIYGRKKLRAFVKVHFEWIGGTLAAEQLMNALNFKSFSYPKVLGYGRVSDGHGGVFGIHIETAAPGVSVDDLIHDLAIEKDGPSRKKLIKQVEKYVERVAQAFSEMHSTPSHGVISKEPCKGVSDAVFRYGKWVLKVLNNHNISPTFDMNDIDRFREPLEKSCLAGPDRTTSIILGDSHTFNVLYDPETDVLTMIDLEPLHHSVDSEYHPKSDGTSDLSIFLAWLQVALLNPGINADERGHVIDAFKNNYRIRGERYDFNNPRFRLDFLFRSFVRVYYEDGALNDKDLPEEKKKFHRELLKEEALSLEKYIKSDSLKAYK